MTADHGMVLVTTTEAILRHKTVKYSDQEVTRAVAAALRTYLGIAQVLTLKPLIKQGRHYSLNNTHVDLQVRTLTEKRVIVARVPDDDEQYQILEDNAVALANAGFDVIRIDNAEVALPREAETGKRFFKSYTNALFLNRVVLIPAFGDMRRDAVAKAAYEAALNDGLPENDDRRYTVKPISAELGIAAIEFSASIRCSARELHWVPSGSDESPQQD